MKAETEQFNIRPDKVLVERLQKLADRFNRRSKATIAVEIIEQYVDFWEQAETVKALEVQKQRQSLNLGGIKAAPSAKKKVAPDAGIEFDEEPFTDIEDQREPLDDERKPKKRRNSG